MKPTYICPSCGSDDLSVEARACSHMRQLGNRYVLSTPTPWVEVGGSVSEWTADVLVEDDWRMRCEQCEWDGEAGEFLSPEGEG